MRSGRFLTRVARWIARVLSGMANRIDRPDVAPAAGMTRPDQAMAALAKRFPGAPEHWLRALAARMPPPGAEAHHQPSEQLPARSPTRLVSERPDLGPRIVASHPAPRSHRVRPVRFWRKQSAARRGSARLLLPGLWRRLQVQLNLLAQGQMRTPRPAAPLIGAVPGAAVVRARPIAAPSLTEPSLPEPSLPEPSQPEPRPDLLFGTSANDDGTRSVSGYPAPWFSPQSGLDGADIAPCTWFDQGLPIDPVQLPSTFGLPAADQNYTELWPVIAPTEVRAANQFPAVNLSRQRPAFVAIGNAALGTAQHRHTHQTVYAATHWPDLPPSDAFIADAEPSPAAQDALRFEQMVGRWSA